jgi:hypothetical protein
VTRFQLICGAFRRRLNLAVLAVLAALLATGYAASRPLGDFVEYWTAGHLLLRHQNPYDFAATLAAEKALGWTGALPLIAPNPPWAIPLVAPLGFFHSYTAAWLVWFLVMGACVALSSWMLMDLYFGNIRIPEISASVTHRALFAFTFFPTLLCLQFGQIAPLVLLGVTGFLWFEERNSPVLAGMALALTAVKPHLVYLVWIAVIVMGARRWRTITAAGAVIIALTSLAVVLDSRIISEYRALLQSHYPQDFYASGLSGIVRNWLGPHDRAWIQFVPVPFGLAWFAMYCRRKKQVWSWREGAPSVITASVLTAPWGFPFDQTVLAVTIIAIAANYARVFGKLPIAAIALYTALNAVLILLVVSMTFWAYLPAPLLLASILHGRVPRSRATVGFP